MALLAWAGPFAAAPARADHHTPTAEGGVMDLRSWNFRTHGPVPLTGRWEFHWHALRDETGRGPGVLVTVPGTWRDVRIPNSGISHRGYGTYRLTLQLPPEPGPLALHVEDVESSYRLYADGRPLGSVGNMNTRGDTDGWRFQPRVYALPAAPGDRMVLEFEVCNYVYKGGGLTRGIRLGSEEEIRHAQQRVRSLDFFMLGGLLLIGLYHLGIFFTRRGDRSSLWFALFCLLMGLRGFVVGERILGEMLPSFPFEYYYKIDFLTIFAAVPVFLLYLFAIFPGESPRSLRIVTLIPGALFSLFVLAFPARIFVYALDPFNFIMIALCLVVFWIVARAAMRRRDGAVVFIAGFAVFFATVMNDVLSSMYVIESVNVASFGFLFFTLSQAYLISLKFQRAFGRSEALSRELEGRVAERTAELAAEQRRLELRNEELVRSEKRFRDLVDLLPVGVYETDGTNALTYANRAALDMFGYTMEEIAAHGYRDTDMLALENREDASLYRRRLLAEGSVLGMEFTGRRRDGTQFPLMVRGRPIDPDDPGTGERGVLIDMTERRRTEQIMRIRLELLQFAGDHTLPELLQRTLDEVENLTGSLVGFYHFVDADQKSLTLQAWSTRTERDFCTARGAGLHYGLDEAGVWVDCVRERRPVIHNDYASLPHRKGLPPGHAPVTRELVVPIMRGERIVAVLGVGNKQQEYTDEDMAVTAYFADIAWVIAERKRDQEALHESEEKYRFIVENSYDMIWTSDEKGVLKYISPSCRELTGWDASEVIGKNVGEFLHPDDLPMAIGAFGKSVNFSERTPGLEYRMRTADGSWRWYTTRGNDVRDGDGSFLMYVGMTRDITEKKEAEALLLESRRMLETVLDTIPVRIFWKSLDLVYLGCNSLFAGDTGKDTPDDVIGLSDYDLAWREQADLYRADDAAVIASGVPKINYEEPQTALGGETIWLRTSKVPLRRASGEIIGILGTYENITEQKRIQEALRESEERFRSFVENANDIVYTLSMEGVFTYVSPNWTELLGHDTGNVVGRYFGNFVDPEDLPRCLAFMKQAIDTGEKQSGIEYRVSHADGSWRWHVSNAAIIEGIGGKADVFLGIARDITQRKMVEAALLASEEKYRQLVENAREAIYVVQDGRFRFVNAMCARLVGLSEDELMGISIYDMVPADDEAALRRHHQELIEGRIPGGLNDFRTIRRDGTVRWLSVNAVRIQWEGHPATLNFATDITDRKAAEMALTRSQINFSTFFNSIEDLLFILDMEGRIIHCNRTAANRLGYRPDELVGRPVIEVHPAERRDEATRIIAAMLEGNEDFCPVPVVTKEGVEIPVETRVVPGEWNGRPALFGVTKDVSKLKMSEDKFSRAFHSSPALMAISTLREGRYLDVNEAFLQSFGFSREKVIGRTSIDLDVFTGDIDRNAVRDQFVSEGTIRNLEIRFRPRKGGVRTGLLNADPIAVGDEPCWLTTMVDITDRKGYEEALRESEERYRLIVENSNELIWTMDSRGVFLYASPSWPRMLGYDVADIVGSPFHRLIFTEDLPRLTEAFKEITSGGGRFPLSEYRVRHADGTWRWHITSGTPVFDEKGALQVFIGITRDITERKEAEERLQESEKRFRDLVDLLPVGVYESDGSFALTYVNKAAAEMFGYPLEEYLDSRINTLDMLVPDERESARERRSRIISEGFVTNLEYSGRKRDGTVFPIVINACLIDPTDPARGTRGVIIDITDRKRAEESLLRAKEAAEEASRAKSEFLANMSHEIRTPMNAIVGFTNLLSQSELSRGQMDYIDKIRSSARLLLSIINDILDFSRIEAGRLPLEVVEFGMDEILDSLANTLAPAAEEKGLELLYDIGAEVPRALKGDPLRIQQVLFNLVHNAVKFTERGTVTMRIRGARDTGDGRILLRFSVTDTGIGLSEEQKKSVFDSFTQADSSTTRRYGGTGLGLAICRRLVALMGGELAVTSEPGRGSEFFFTLPFEAVGERGEMAARAPVERAEFLLVDDSPASLEILSGYLAAMGMAVKTAGSGEEAVAIMRSRAGGDPLILIIDWRMPGMDGVHTIEAVREDPGIAPPVSIIMVSAYNIDDIKERSRGLGVDAFLAKPVSPSGLYNAINRAMHPSAQPRRREPAEGAPKAHHGSLAGRRVLLAEDNSFNRQVAREMLQRIKVNVDTAVDGAEAVEKVRLGAYDLVLMDIQMSVMDGFEATRELRSDSRFSDLPIIAMTAYAMSGDRERCLDAGMNDHIPKPFEPDTLYAVLAKWLAPGAPVETGSVPAGKGKRGVVLPDSLPGIDMEAARLRTAGDDELLLALLNEFCRVYGNSSGTVKEFLEGGRYEELQRFAHGVRGSAGAVGAAALHRAATGLEEAIMRKRTSALKRRAGAFNRAMEQVLGVAESIRSTAGAEPGEAGGEGEGLREALSVLAGLLRRHSYSALEHWERVAPRLPDSVAESAGEIGGHIRSFRYDEAGRALERLLGTLNDQEEGRCRKY